MLQFGRIGGLIIGKAICSAVGNVPGFSFAEYTFPAVSVVFYFLLVFALQFVLTKWAGLYCRRNSVVERWKRQSCQGSGTRFQSLSYGKAVCCPGQWRETARHQRHCKEAGEAEPRQREAPEPDGGDRRCPGGVPDLFCSWKRQWRRYFLPFPPHWTGYRSRYSHPESSRCPRANTTCWGRSTRSGATTPPMCTATAT